MSVTVSIEFEGEGASSYGTVLRRWPDMLQENLMIAARTIGEYEVALALRYLSPKFASGRLAHGIGYDVRSLPAGVAVDLTSAESYWINVEKGRRAGAPMPPQGVLLEWMSLMGIPLSAEFPVRRAIAQRGIPAHPFVSTAYQETTSMDGFAQQEFLAAVEKTIDQMAGFA